MALADRANLLAKDAIFFERDVQLVGGNPNRCSEKFVKRTQLLRTDRDQSRLTGKYPGKMSGFEVKRILGKGDLWITEYTITYQGTGIHAEYYGVPQWQGRPRNTVFRGSLRGVGLEEAMGSADRVTPH